MMKEAERKRIRKGKRDRDFKYMYMSWFCCWFLKKKLKIKSCLNALRAREIEGVRRRHRETF